MKPQALLLVLLVAILVLAGWFTFSRGQDAVVPTGAGDQAGQVAARSGDTTELATAELPATPAVGSAADAGQAKAARTAAPDVVPTLPSAKGYRIRGRIVDGEGAPRAGLELSAPLFRSFVEGGFAGGDLPQSVGANRPRQLECTTLRDGTFELRVPENRDGSLEVVDGDHVFRDRSPQFRRQQGDQDLGDLVVVRSSVLEGIVQDERGEPVGEVLVKASLGPLGIGMQSMCSTAADGTFSVGKLRRGMWTLRTESSRFLPTTEQFELTAEQRLTGLVLVVAEGRAIAGRVIDDRGIGVEGIKVGCRRQEMRGGMDLQRFSPDEATTTAADGAFSLAGLSGDKVTVRASDLGTLP